MKNSESRLRWPALLSVAIVVALFGSATPAAALKTESLDGPSGSDPTDLQSGDTVVVETFTLAGDMISVEAFDASGAAMPVPIGFERHGPVGASEEMLQDVADFNARSGGEVVGLGSGSGGSSSSSGCMTVTVNNKKGSLFGATLFWYHTWTHWCWNRASNTTSSISTGWYLSDVDPLWSYESTIVNNRWHYSWISGYSLSGYRHERQAHMQSCLFSICQHSYPHNWLWSHSNGTYAWQTQD